MNQVRTVGLVASLAIMTGISACGKAPEVDAAWADAPLPSDSGMVDDRMADTGAELFRKYCAACHYIGGDDPDAGLGPNLEGVTRRRDAEWIRAMISNADSMLVADSTVGRLYEEYGIRMLDVNATPAETRALIEFLWRADRGSPDTRSGGP